MNNSQRLQENNARIEAVTELLKSKAAGSGGGFNPSGEINIRENGKHNVKKFEFANVSVQPKLQKKVVYDNGDVVPDEGYDGLIKVTVDVEKGVFPEGTLDITENGEHNVATYEKVSVNVGEEGSDGLARYVAGDDTLTELMPSAFGAITELKDGAFYVNSSTYQKLPTVTKITLPNRVTKLGKYCFYNNTALQEINTENVDTMGDYCFGGCTGLKHIDISKVAEKGRLPQYLLYNCNSVENIITGKYGSNPYISPSTYSLYGLTNLKNVNNGENILRVISANSGTSYQCAYISRNLEEPVIDVEDYSSRWATSGSGIKYTYAYSKFRSFTYVNAYEFKQGGAGYIKEGAFSGATVIDMYMPKVTNLGDNRAISGITQLKRLHIPVVTNILGTAIPTSCEKAIIGDTSPILSSAMTSNTTTKFYVPYTKIEYYSNATNWSALFLNNGEEETRFVVYGDFASGNTLPTKIGIISGYNVTWYEDEDCTILASDTATEDKRYYGKLIYAGAALEINPFYTGSTTTVTHSVDCEVGDTLLAYFNARSAITEPEGWTKVTMVDGIYADDNSYGQGTYLYTKVATQTTESITVTTASSESKYVTIVNIKDKKASIIDSLTKVNNITYGTPLTVTNTTDNMLLYCFGNIYAFSENTASWVVSGNYNLYKTNQSPYSERLNMIVSTKGAGTSFTITSNMSGTRGICSIALELE